MKEFVQSNCPGYIAAKLQGMKYREDNQMFIIIRRDLSGHNGKIYTNYEYAYREAQRKSKINPGKVYVIFEAVAGVVSMEKKEFETTHINYKIKEKTNEAENFPRC